MSTNPEPVDIVSEVITAWWADHRPALYARILHRTRDTHLAEDIVAETFVRAVRRLREPDAVIPDEPAAWLYTVARNLVIDHSRRLRVRSETPWPDVPEGAVPFPSRPVTSDFDDVEHRESFEEALVLLPLPQQVVMRLRDLHGLSTAETAKAMGRSAQAVRSLRYKATRALREQNNVLPHTSEENVDKEGRTQP